MVDRFKLVAAVVLMLTWSWASAGVQLSSFPPNPGVLAGGGWQFGPGNNFGAPTPPRAWVNGVYGGVPKAIATDIVTVAGRVGPVAISVASAVPMAEAVAAVGRCVLGVNPICAVGTAAYLLYKAHRTMPKADVPGSVVPDGQLDFDPGTPTVQSDCNGWKEYWRGTPTAVCSEQAWCSDWAAYIVPAYSPGSTGFGVTSGSYPNTFCLAKSTAADGTTRIVTSTPMGGGEAVKSSKCPQSVDAFNPAYTIPAGMAPGVDGLCPSARGNHRGITPDEFAGKDPWNGAGTLPNVKPDWSTWQPGVGDAVDKGGQTVPSEITATGPASQTGSPSSTTTTEGSPPVTTTTTTTPTINYTYNGDKVTYNTTTTTNTCVGAGSCSAATATTTTTTTPAAVAPQDPTDPCTANPNRLGCMEAGVAPDKSIGRQDVQISAMPQSGWGADTGVCPAPSSVKVLGQTVMVDNSLVCQFMSGIRFAVIGACGLVAAALFVAGLKS